MQKDQASTTAQLRDDIDSGRTGSKADAPDPAASPLGTDDEAAGTTPSAERVEMARKAERKIGEAAKSDASRTAEDEAHDQRGSSAPYAREEHMNEELAKRTKEGES